MSNTKAIGVDVAKWNPIQSYTAMKADGINFAIPKAINKSLKKDDLFETHMKGFEKAEINIIGTYHYTYATDTSKAKQCAKAWVDAVDERCNIFFLDWEDASLPTKNAATMKNIISAYADVIQNAGYTMAIYTGMSLYNNYMKKLSLPYDLWIARYYASTKPFYTKEEPDERYRPTSDRLIGWQYTSNGAVNGAAGLLDMDIWYETAVKSKTTINAEHNPFTEPTQTVKLGTLGNDANWVLWYLWRFGMLLDVDGNPDSTRINGIIDSAAVEAIKTSQRTLGATADGKVGKITRALYKKVC